MTENNVSSEIKRINVEKNYSKEDPVNPKNFLAPRRKASFLGRKGKRIILFVLLAIIIILLVTVSPFLFIYKDIKEVQALGSEVYSQIKNQDLSNADVKLSKLEEKLVKIKGKTKLFFYLRIIPYYRDGERILDIALSGVRAGKIAIEAITPYADLLGLKGGSTFVSKSTDERIVTAVKTLDKLNPKISDIAQELKEAEKNINQINPQIYPQKIGQLVVRQKIIEMQETAKGTIGIFVEAEPLLKVLPKLLGEPDKKRYLILFQNDKELRATGGFLTAYAIFEVQSGKLKVVKADDIYKLDEARNAKTAAPPEILKYHKGVYYFYLRDSNLSPDFYQSMKTFEELYDDIKGKEEIDGIIAVDTHVLVEAIKILGAIPAYGTNFTAENDPRCNCPQVIYELERYADQPVNYERGSRKDIIGVLLYQIMQKALGVSPGQYWGRLFQMGLSEMQQKHILFYFHNEEAQRGIEALNFGGRIASKEEKILGYEEQSWDYLHINDTNFAGAKANMFVEEKVTVNSEVKGNEVIKTVIIDYRNPAPPSDCGLESGGLCLNAPLRNWLRVYVPKGSQLLEFKGSETEPQIKEDLGKTVFEGFLIINPQGSARVIVKYKLPVSFNKSARFLIQKQPGTDGHEYYLQINGREKEKFQLKTDKKIEL